MIKKTIADQLIEFIKDHADRVNRESFCKIEFVVQGGKLDGMRTQEYIKNMKKD